MTTSTAIAAPEFRTVPIEGVRESRTNPRRHFDDKAMKELVASVKEKGVLVPLLVRDIPAENGNGVKIPAHCEIVAGARRYRAAKAAGLKEIPVLVHDLTDEQALEAQVIENLQRADVHPLDEAEGYAALMKKTGQDVAAIAAKVGKSESYVYQRLKLAELAEPAKKAFLEDKITAGHAILVARLQPADQVEAVQHCIQEVDVNEGDPEDWGHQVKIEKALVPVRALQRWIDDEIHTDLKKMPWDMADAKLVEKAGPCSTCPKRTGNAPALFADVQKDSTCTDRACFKQKFNAWIDRKIKELKAAGKKAIVISEEQHNWRLAPVEGRAGVKRAGEWHSLGKKKCRNHGKGIVFEGKARGQVLDVCVAASCGVHNPKPTYSHYSGGSSSKPTSPAQIEKEQKAEAARALKRKRDDELTDALYLAALEKAPAKIESEDIYQIAWEYCENNDQAPAALNKLFPFLERYGNSSKDLEKLKEKDLLKLIRGHLLSRWQDIDAKAVVEACKRWKVPVAKIKAELQKRWKQEDKNPVTANADGTYKEPTCTKCGCTTLAPCEEGCGWAKLDKKTNAGLCTACE